MAAATSEVEDFTIQALGSRGSVAYLSYILIPRNHLSRIAGETITFLLQINMSSKFEDMGLVLTKLQCALKIHIIAL